MDVAAITDATTDVMTDVTTMMRDVVSVKLEVASMKSKDPLMELNPVSTELTEV